MYKRKKILCVIPARGGSKGLPEKNIKLFFGKPLIAYSIEQAKESKYIDKIIVSTDNKEIATIAKNYGAKIPFIRPAELATDTSSTIDVLLHAIDWMENKEHFTFEILLLLHTTTPLRVVKDIDNCIELLVEKKFDNVFSVTEAHRNPYFNMVEINKDGQVKLVKNGTIITRQSAPPVYDMNSSIYVWWKDILKKEKKIILPKTHIYITPKERSIDIDDAIDFRIAEVLKMMVLKENEIVSNV